MTPAPERFAVLDRYIVPVFTAFAATVLFVLMMLTCVDVVGRYLFNRPLFGGFELTELMLATLIFAGLPLVSLRNEHVTIDLFDAVTPEWLFRIQHVIACLVGAGCCAYLSWRLWLRADQLWAAGETTAQLRIRMAWLAYAMSVLMGFTALCIAVLATRRPQRHIIGAEDGGNV